MIPLRDSVPVRSWPVVTYALIVANVWLFFYELSLGPEVERFIRVWGFEPARHFFLAETDPGSWVGRYLPVVTSMFLHGGWMHLIGNMVYLWIFGDNVEDRLGHLRYLLFYLVAGAGAALAHAYLHPDSTVPTDRCERRDQRSAACSGATSCCFPTRGCSRSFYSSSSSPTSSSFRQCSFSACGF